jgi:hypothetical protein
MAKPVAIPTLCAARHIRTKTEILAGEPPLASVVPASKGRKRYRVSGHEGFPCRYTWLPKTVRGLKQPKNLLADEENAMVALGLGKNMVRSARFWAQAAGVVEPAKEGQKVTEFGKMLLDDKDGLDPFLEDITTLWLIHWKLSTDVKNPLLAWDYLLNRWHAPELVRSAALKHLEKELGNFEDKLSLATLAQHFDTFIHTYVPTRGRKAVVQEDSLDCPLVELELLVKVGERNSDGSTSERETIYAFRREEKPEISEDLFIYCLNDFWECRQQKEETLALRDLAYGYGSPGQIFKLPEENIRSRVEALENQTGGMFLYADSANLQQIRRVRKPDSKMLLKAIYR